MKGIISVFAVVFLLQSCCNKNKNVDSQSPNKSNEVSEVKETLAQNESISVGTIERQLPAKEFKYRLLGWSIMEGKNSSELERFLLVNALDSIYKFEIESYERSDIQSRRGVPNNLDVTNSGIFVKVPRDVWDSAKEAGILMIDLKTKKQSCKVINFSEIKIIE